MPFDVDHPYLIKDPNFDIENHVNHVRLPEPADWRQFCILCARHATPFFDMSKPLWHMMVVEGLDNVPWLAKGSFAILLRAHHALVDGTAAIELLRVLHDLDPKGKLSTGNVEIGEDFPSAMPGPFIQTVRATRNNVKGLLRMTPPVLSAATKLPNLLKDYFDEKEGAMGKAPRTRFNARVSQQRVYVTERFSLEEIKAYRSLVPGATVNDCCSIDHWRRITFLSR